MEFSVIYSFDLPRETPVSRFQPPHHRQLWDMTEQSDNLDDAEIEGYPKHRKYCAILTREQFDDFVYFCRLYAEPVETLGSIGAPGCGFGIVPAVAFSNYDPGDMGGVSTAYVTPLCKKTIKTNRQWQRLRRAVISQYS